MSKNTINSIDDFITGEKFYQIADLIYTPNIKSEFDDYNKIENTFNIKKLKDINVVYTHTLYVKHLFKIIKDITVKFIIITHNSDINIDNSFEIPDNVIHWYSQNVNVIKNNLTSIPIGLENKRWFKDINKKQKMLDILNTDKDIKNLVYINHNIKNNPTERLLPYEVLYDKSYATIEYGTNGTNFDNYLYNIYNHNFVICPIGNGIDTHRMWECLYLNTIPIVKTNINNLFYKNHLPICFVDEWRDLDKNFLEEQYIKINTKFYNFDMLKIDYWKTKIDYHRN